jgi:hypothetical protein
MATLWPVKFQNIEESVSQAVQSEWDGMGIYLTGIDCDSDTGSSVATFLSQFFIAWKINI